MPRPVTHMLPPSSARRSAAASPPATVARRFASLVATSMWKSVLSRCVITQAFFPAKTMSAGPSPTGMCAITLFAEGETRTTSAP